MAPSAIYPEQSKVVHTTLNHYLEPALGGHSTYYAATAGYYRRSFDNRPVQINDIRGQEGDFDLNTQGFQHVRHTSAEKDFINDEQIKRVVYPETEALLKEVTGATSAHVFSHILRRDSREKTEATVKADQSLANDNAPVKEVTPARFIHIDQSNDGAVEVLRDNMPPELAEKLAKTRWSIINVWRPIKPISKDPLAVCDARTVRDEDLVPITAVLPPKGTGQYADISRGEGFEVYYCRYNPEQTWYYASAMKPDEVLFIKCFDSIRDGKTARRVPHTAFTDASTKDDVTRESIEVRTLVFYEDQPN